MKRSPGRADVAFSTYGVAGYNAPTITWKAVLAKNAKAAKNAKVGFPLPIERSGSKAPVLSPKPPVA
jgi:hypothetical protein